MKTLTEFTIPRTYFEINDIHNVEKYELFGFSDASPEAYGACIYQGRRNGFQREGARLLVS